VRAYYLKIWLEDEVAHLSSCPWEEDLTYAQQVCAQLGVVLETVSLQREYWAEVVQYTFAEARAGRTPNPDIMCNSRVKFGAFYNYVGRYHYKIATGHYAQVGAEDPMALLLAHPDQPVMLVRSPDPIKDQSYFLCTLRQEQLRKCLFPIGHLQKSQVRGLAEEFDLPTKARKDSQGICFLGKLKFDDFIAHYLGQSPGPIVDYQSGRVVGAHKGLWFHTIGQRKGVGLLLQGVVHLGPWFVASKHAPSNTLYVTNKLEVVRQPRLTFRVGEINWINGAPKELLYQGQGQGQEQGQGQGGVELEMKLRHSPNLVRGFVTRDDAGAGAAGMGAGAVDKGIAPGQFAAFYIGVVCVGAGVVT
ncbi:5-methylaminomethyl-2-thiouridylate-methyltransferase, partial [Ochromonadaceae sp. CCMP2298]